MRRSAGAAAFAAFASCVACAHLAPRSVAECPGSLTPSDRIEGRFVLHQRVRVTAPGVDYALLLAVEKRDAELAVAGIDPVGAVVFRLVQRGLEVDVDALPAAALPVPPINYLRDLHRTRFGSPGGTRGAPVHVERRGPDELLVRNPTCGYEARIVTVLDEALP